LICNLKFIELNINRIKIFINLRKKKTSSKQITLKYVYRQEANEERDTEDSEEIGEGAIDRSH
jgi:hypothetical protein